KSHGALPPKDPFPEVLDWAAKVEIAEAKKAHNEAWKTECKDKVAQKKQAKLAQLDADRLAGKPPLRGCVQCKTHHWEQDPCPPKPMASPEKEASKIKSSGVGKRKHTGAEIENSGGPSKKELTQGMRAAGLVPIRASNQSGASTLEWLIRFGSSSDAEEAVDKPFHLRGVEVRLTPFFKEGLRTFICKTLGPVSMAALIKSIHKYAPKAKFGLRREEAFGCMGDKCLLTFGQPQNFNRISLVFNTALWVAIV
ncbi:conserved uncharacterized protein (C-terminal fragment), partial [Ustilago hordei]